jgi:hypothetical protein
MSIKDNLSKKNTSLLLMTALIIGIIVVITQLASAGSQKNENPSIQNPNLNDSSKVKSIINNTNTINSNVTKPAVQASNSTDNVTKPAVQASNSTDNVTKPAVQASNSTDNVTKPAVQASNSILGIINTSTKNNSEIVSLQTVKSPKIDQISNKKDSEAKPNSKTKSSDGSIELKNKVQSQQQKNKDNIKHNNIDKKEKDKGESKSKNNQKPNQSLKEGQNSLSHLKHKTNKPTIESIPSQSFDLPFTAVVPKDLF